MRRRTIRRRGMSYARGVGVQELERRLLLFVTFDAGPGEAPGVNRPDIPTGITNGTTEIAMEINPLDPGNLAIANQSRLVTTTNGGATFSTQLSFGTSFLSGTTFPTTNGDPDLAFDSQGRLFYTNLASGAGQPRTVAVGRVNPSTGAAIGGGTFLPTLSASSSYDKQFMAGDTNPLNISADNLYMTWVELQGQAQVLFSRSTNANGSWSAPLSLYTQVGADALPWPPDVKVDYADGDVYVVHPIDPGDETGGLIRLRRSTDEGVSFGANRTPFPAGMAGLTTNAQTWTGNGPFVPPTDVVPGARFWTIGSRQPWVLPDPARPGNVYVITADDPNDNFGNGDDADVVIARSDDNGATWTQDTISSGPGNSFQFMPTAAIDRFGNIVVAWYDNRRGLLDPSGSGDFLLDVRATYSTDGGQTWVPSFMVNDPNNPLTPVTAGTSIRSNGVDLDGDGSTTDIDGDETYRIGEYFNIEIFGGTAYVSWNGNTFTGSTPTGHQAWFQAFPIPGAVGILGDIAAADTVIVRSMSANTDFCEILVNGVREYAGLWAGVSELTINTGGGDDTVFVRDAPGGIPVTLLLGGGDDHVEFGDGDLDTNTPGVHVVDGGPGAGDELFIMDSLDVGNDTYTITGTTFDKTGLGSLAFPEFESVEVRAGEGNNPINVLSLPAAVDLRVRGFQGDDEVNLGSGDLDNQILGAVDVDGFSGNDFIRFFDQNDTGSDDYTIGNGSMTKSAPTAFGGATWEGVENVVLTGNDSANTFDVTGVPASVALTLNGRAGADTFHLGLAPGDTEGRLGELILGSVSVIAGDGVDEVWLDDSIGTGADTYLFNLNLFQQTGSGLIAYSEAEEVVLDANAQDNTIFYPNGLAGVAVTVNGSLGDDTLQFAAGDVDSTVFSSLRFNGGVNEDLLVVNDGMDDTGNDDYFIGLGTFSKFNFTGALTFTGTDFSLTASNQDNGIFINATDVGMDVTVQGSSGDDYVRVGNGRVSDVLANVFVHGGFGEDTMDLDDHLDAAGNDDYFLTPTTFDKTGLVGSVQYTFVNRVLINANPFDNGVEISGTEVDVDVTVTGNAGADRLHVNGPPSSDITFNGLAPGAAPGDVLFLTGAKGSTGEVVPHATLKGNGVAQFDGHGITFTGLEGSSPQVFVDTFDEFRYVTPGAVDAVNVTANLLQSSNAVGGTSDLNALLDVSFDDVGTFVLDTGANDAGRPAASDDVVNVQGFGLIATGLAEFRLIGGGGEDTLNVNGGAFEFLRDASPDTQHLTVNVAGAAGATARFRATNHLRALNQDAVQYGSAVGVGVTLVNLRPNGAAPLVGGGSLDLGEQAMIVDYAGAVSPLGTPGAAGTIAARIAAGYAGGTWAGVGVRSSSAAASGVNDGVGYAEAADLVGGGGGTFLGEAVDGSAALLRYTLGGDANLDGSVNFNDLVLLAQNYNVLDGLRTWRSGDFTFDGNIDFNDLVVQAQNYNASLPAPAVPAVRAMARRLPLFSVTPIGDEGDREGVLWS